MKWAYSIRRKISVAFLLSAVFLLLFVTNVIDSKNVTQLGSSFSSVYEDRLLVESYIYRMSEHLFRKKIMLDTCSTNASATRVRPLVHQFNESISKIIAEYEKTRLTGDETLYFNKFKENVANLVELEERHLMSVARADKSVAARSMMNTQFNEASHNLDQLSAIQISEGKILNEDSKKIVAGSWLVTRFEIAILIAIGLIILVLVFESTTVFTNSHKPSLN